MTINPDLSVTDLCQGIMSIPPAQVQNPEVWESILDTIEQDHPAIAAFVVLQLVNEYEEIILANVLTNLLIERRMRLVGNDFSITPLTRLSVAII